MTALPAFTIEDDISDQIINQVIDADTYISTLDDKSPNPKLNALLSKLVELVSPTYTHPFVQNILSNLSVKPRLTSLRQNLGHCEYALEKFWNKKILTENLAYTDYPYIQNYYALVGAEGDTLEQFTTMTDQNVVFIGSGPMPLSAFELKNKYPAITLSCIEMMADAIQMSSAMCAHSQIEMAHIHAHAETADFSQADIVFIASMTISKFNVLKRIKETAQDGTIIGVRTVEELRNVLYEPVQASDIPDGYTYLGKTEYDPSHVNTTLFYCLNKN